MREVCSCSASFEIMRVDEWSIEALIEAFKDWRENHRHEMPEPEPGDPLIHESGSATERAEPHWDDARPIIGFTAG